MDINHIELQYNRLARHYKSALNKDHISFLDLSHVLRIFTEMKSGIDIIANKKEVSFHFENFKCSPETKKVLKGKHYTYLPVASGVPTPGMEISGFMQLEGELSEEEFLRISKAGPPVTEKTNLTFGQWLGSTIYEVPSFDKSHPKMGISREIFVKRIANILGASHPQGADKGQEQENKFDVYIRDLHLVTLADGYPATYFQLLEIAKDILDGLKNLF